MRRSTARLLDWGAAGIGLVVLSACGGFGADDGGRAATGDAGPGKRPATVVVDEDAKALVFSECLRANGLDMPEPAPGEDGFLDAFHSAVENVDEATAQQVVATCDGFFPTYGADGHGGDTAASLALAECLRGQGVDVPDGLFENGALRTIDPVDLRSALDDCRDVVAGARR
jgi:hypothetical protein